VFINLVLLLYMLILTSALIRQNMLSILLTTYSFDRAHAWAEIVLMCAHGCGEACNSW